MPPGVPRSGRSIWRKRNEVHHRHEPHSAWVQYLSESGHDAVHWAQIGAHDAPDAEVMNWAAAEDRVLLTSDLDFGANLASSGNSRPSVVQLGTDLLGPSEAGPELLDALARLETELGAGALLSVDAKRARVRVLPLTF